MAEPISIDITIIIICRSGYQGLHKLINSLNSQNLAMQIIVLANERNAQVHEYLATHVHKGLKLISFNENFIDVLNTTVANVTSKLLLIVEAGYLLGHNFLFNAEEFISKGNTLVHPRFCIYYSGQSALRIFNTNQSRDLFEKTVFEDLILGSTELIKKIKFTNLFGNEFWQFYCDAIAAGFKIEFPAKRIIFKTNYYQTGISCVNSTNG